MAEQSNLPPLLRCRNCGHTTSVSDAPPPESPQASRCPRCGERRLILTTERLETRIKFN